MPEPLTVRFELGPTWGGWRCAQWLLIFAGMIGLFLGCKTGSDKVTYLGNAELDYYKQSATEIAYPLLEDELNSSAWETAEPRRIRHLEKDETWDMSLPEAIQIALTNSRVIKTRGQFLQPGTTLLAGNATVYDPAIQETGSLLGSRGVEAALADFDAQFTTSATWGRNELVQNNLFQSGGLAAGNTLTEDSAAVVASLQKQFAYGGSATLSHEWNYSLNNAPARLFGSTYTGRVRGDYRQPLWAGAGTEFTRIAGPIAQNVQGVSGVSQGVLIARINADISIADFEARVRNMLKEVEDLYWDLSLTYYVWDSEVAARANALFIWRRIKNGPDPAAADEAQALENYHERRARSESALADLLETESQLRRMLGLPVNDGRIIRPVDEPLTAEYIPDWHVSLADALGNRVELRRQKWEIKSLQLQLKAAKKLTRPRLDFVSGYQVNGFGDHLLGQNDNDTATAQGLDSAYETLTQGDQTGWDLGFEFSVPVGLRAARSQQRHYEHRLRRAQALLASQEMEVSHELAHAFQTLDRWYSQSIAQYGRRQAAQRRVDAYQALFDSGLDRSAGENSSQNLLDLLIRAEESLAEANVSFQQSLTEYNKAISNLYFRKGTLLQRDGVYLAEGDWHPTANKQALDKAWARSYAFDAPYLKTKPAEIAVPSLGFIRHADANELEAGFIDEEYIDPPIPVEPDFSAEPDSRFDSDSSQQAAEHDVSWMRPSP